MSPTTSPSGSDPIKGTPPSKGMANSPKVSNTAPKEGTPASDEFVIASEVQRVDNPPSAPVRESLASTVTQFLQRRTGNKPEVLDRALEILGIENNDEPGGPITSA